MPKKIIIDGVIGWDITSGRIRQQLKDAGSDDIVIEISSPGGFVYEGSTIFNLIKNYKGHVTTHLMGLAASMASYIALAGNHIKAEDNAVFMIHNAWGFAVGDFNEFLKVSKELDGLSSLMARMYALKSGKSIDEIRELMDDETFFFGSAMKEAGFIDEMIPLADKNDDDKKKLKSEAMALARISIKNCISVMKKAEIKDDFQQAAALLKIDYKCENVNSDSEDIGSDEQRAATNAENTQKEVKEMPTSLKEFLAENAHCKAELDVAINEGFEKGVAKCTAEFEAKCKKIAPFLADSQPKFIRSLAIKAMAGEIEPDAVITAAAMWDAQKEQGNQDAAEGETNEQDETIGDTSALSPDGVIRTEEDLQASRDRIKPKS